MDFQHNVRTQLLLPYIPLLLVESDDNVFPIVTPFKADAWEKALEKAGVLEEYRDIISGITEGFSVGLEDYELSAMFMPENHYTSAEDEAFVEEKYGEEIKQGRMSAGYEPSALHDRIGHFRTALLAVVTSGVSSKCRVIVNHSYPDKAKNKINLGSGGKLRDATEAKILLDPTTTSINTVITSKQFQCAWGTFSKCYILMAEAPEGTQAAVFDVQSAFRNVPMHPTAQCFLAIMIKGLIHLDHVANFGASSAPGIWGRIADAMAQIL